MKDNSEKQFHQIIDEAFAKINSYPDGNSLFYQRFTKSRAVVSSWKSRKVRPTETDQIHFISVSNDVIRDCEAERVQKEAQRIDLINEFQALVSL